VAFVAKSATNQPIITREHGMSAHRPDTNRDQARVLDRRAGWWGGAAAALVVLVLALLIVRPWTPLLELDQRVDTAIHGWALQNSWAVSASLTLQTMGSFRVSFWVTAVTTMLLLIARRWWTALTLVVLAALAPLITDWIKPVVGRARPVWEQSLGSEVTLSYPSGHATAGIAVYAAAGVALGSLLRDATLGAVVATAGILLGVAIGLSRLVLGVHWPSDVVGGWCVALAVAGVASALFVLPPPRGQDR
jgi:undecaprenyl-diphosphatase